MVTIADLENQLEEVAYFNQAPRSSYEHGWHFDNNGAKDTLISL